jgi:hypothetical protein
MYQIITKYTTILQNIPQYYKLYHDTTNYVYHDTTNYTTIPQTIPQYRKIYHKIHHNTTKCTKWQYLLAIKCTNFFDCNTLEKFTHIGIFGLKICYLVTLTGASALSFYVSSLPAELGMCPGYRVVALKCIF